MIFCNNYNIAMQPVMSFSKDKREKFVDVQNVMKKQNIENLEMTNWTLEKY